MGFEEMFLEERKASREEERGEEEIESGTCLFYSFIFNKSLSEHTIQVRQSLPVHSRAGGSDFSTVQI